MSEEATKLADKLLSEGERTLVFFRALTAHDWARHVYADGAHWTVRQAFEHLALSERSMLRLCEGLLAGGKGAPEDFDIDRFNREHTTEGCPSRNADIFRHPPGDHRIRPRPR
jgi:hypothetical protein